MESNQSQSPSYRAVLIGIDAYTRKPLDGCVNDIDRIQEILLDRLGVPPERITRLAAPHEGATHSTRIPSLAPTQEEIRNVLERLAGEVGPQDVVFLYYSGHGSQAMTSLNGALVAREALLPVDHYNPGGAARLLYDFELNGLFSRIAERSGDLTVVLDCCHSASATREDIAPELRNRFCPVEGVQEISPMIVYPALSKDGAGLAPPNASHLLVASCRACELSWETLSGGVAHGAFTWALAGILEQTGRPLPELRWGDIWTALRDRLAQCNAQQNPLIVGRWERRLFGGPWEPRDLGFEIRQDGDRFRIEAGTLADLSPGAELAVYGEKPDLFPPFGSDEERTARIGSVRVETADRASAVAISTNGSFRLPAAARARLFRPGEVDRLPVRLQPPATLELRTYLEAGGVLTVVDEPEQAEAVVRADGRGTYHLGDALYGDGSDPARPALFSFPATSPVVLRRVLEHYADYNRVLRIPRRCTDLPGALSVELLDCVDLRGITIENFQAPPLRALPFDLSYKFEVKEGEGFAISIRNQGPELLHVTVLNCAGSGRIEFLGQAEVKPGALQTLWQDGKLGIPFDPRVATDRASIVDRLVVVGTTLPGQDLSYFAKNVSFAKAMEIDRDAGTRGDKPPVEQWTAVMVPLLIQR
jgi:hypothetical protein